MGRWHKTKTDKPSEQTFETKPYKTASVWADAARELPHAHEQLAPARQYPGWGFFSSPKFYAQWNMTMGRS
jgi:hypothetical protein